MQRIRTLGVVAVLALATSACTTWTWGYNASGQLGNSTTTNSSSPVSLGVDYIDASAAASHTCHVTTTNDLRCWGDNFNGQLGDGTTTDRTAPTAVGTDTDWRTVEAGGVASLLNTSFTCAIKQDSTLWCWGNNGWGQLGLGDTTNRSTPTQVGTDTDWRAIATGGAGICALRGGLGELWCWGGGAPEESSILTSPTRVGTDTGWTNIDLGAEHGCAIRDNELHCWGINRDGQLGDGTTTDEPDLERIGTDSDWLVLGLGASHSCAIKTDRTLWCWGSNTTGHLGDGTTTERHSPVQIGTDSDWLIIAGGGARWTVPFVIEHGHTCGTRAGGTLWCWGYNLSGQVGDGTTTTRLSPTQVGAGAFWMIVDLGENHTAALEF